MYACLRAAAALLTLAWSLLPGWGREVLIVEASRETVLDRKVHLSDQIVMGVPDVPPLCDNIPGLTRHRVPVEGGSLYCESEGKGTPLVLVSGGPGCSHHIFHPHFSRAATFAQVIYYDQRGVGQSDSDATGEKYTVKQAVEDLDRLRTEFGIDKWVVLGHSYGGFLAQCYALEHPEHVLGLVLVCAEPGMPGLALEPTRQYDFLTQEERDRITRVWSQEGITREQGVYSAHWNGDWKRQAYYRPTDEELARTARYEWTPAAGFREHITKDLNYIDLQGLFADFEIPTLLVEAQWDLTWNTDKPHKLKANHPHGELTIFEHAGHSPFMDEPNRFFSVLAAFVARAEKTPPARLPAHRVAWPPSVLLAIMNLPYTGACEQAKPLLQKAKDAGLTDASGWLNLGLRLYDGGAYTEALECFERTASLPKASDLDRFGGLVWQGHVLDLLGRREEALARYRDALKVNIGPGGCIQHGQYGLLINRAWAEARLKMPFDRRAMSVAAAIRQLPWIGASEQAKPLLQQAKDVGLSSGDAWFFLGLRLYDGSAYTEALECFERSSGLPASDLYHFAALVWQGHILDLQGKRDGALARYRDALKVDIGPGGCMQHSQYGLAITRAWAEERLKTPFQRPDAGTR